MLRIADQTARLRAVDRQRAQASSAQPLRDRGTLLMLEGPTAGKVFGLTGGDLLFGRGAECSARIQDAGLSRRHARIFRLEDQFFIEDLGSTNGTYVNGRRLEGVLDLQGHDRIRMGCDVLLRFDPHDISEQETVSGLYESSVRDPLYHGLQQATSAREARGRSLLRAPPRAPAHGHPDRRGPLQGRQ